MSDNIAATMLIVMTRSFPGGWRKGTDVPSLLKSLKEEWRDYVEDYGFQVYAVHPRSYINDMGGFVYPTGHDPKLIEQHDGKKNKPKTRRAR
jgi:hypothetical protein